MQGRPRFLPACLVKKTGKYKYEVDIKNLEGDN